MLNALGFWFRTFIKWSRPGYNEPAQSKCGLWHRREAVTELLAREAELLETYLLEVFRNKSSRLRYQETLTYLDYLEHLLPAPQFNSPIRWLDVGVKNWSYVEALYAFIQHHGQLAQLQGIELDAYRVYSDLYSRFDYAQAYIKPLDNTCYEVRNVMAHQSQYQVVSCFLPFVLIEPCLKWGLPEQVF